MDNNTILLIIQIILLPVQIASLIALIVYVVKTWHIASATKESAKATEKSADISRQTLDEMKESRDQEIAPYVVAFFDNPLNKPLIYLIIKNIGKSIAENVKFEFKPLLVSSIKPINEMPFVKDGIGSMPPGYEIRVLFDNGIAIFDGKHDLPLTYNLRISYFGGIIAKPRVNEMILDLSAIKSSFIGGKDIGDLINKIDELSKSIGATERNLESISDRIADGIWIKNPEIFTTNLQTNAEDLKLTAFAKLEEFKTLWIYGV